MRIERRENDQATTSDIVVIGRGTVGEKAQQLIDKTPTLRNLGFTVPKRTILTEGFFDEFFQRNRLGSNLRDVVANETTEQKIRKGSFTPTQFDTLRNICQRYGDSPLVIRSSAEGDARGTGTYKSVFVENNIRDVRKALQQVLASYFSPDAIAFRKDAQTGEGFGIIIEPVIGHDFDGYVAPILSGFGYTSTSRGEGYINIVPGLGCAVESRNSERITESVIKKFDSLKDYIIDERKQMALGWKTTRRTSLLQNTFQADIGSYRANAFFRANRYRPAEILDTSIEYPSDVQHTLNDLDLSKLFSAMKQMESTFGCPQYFEWTMTVENGNPLFWIVQIADVTKKLDVMDFGDYGKVFFMGHTVTGTGIKETAKIVMCWNPEDIERLNNFNKHNTDYVLIFSSRLTHIDSKISYNDFSNASVFLEIQDMGHIDDPVAHLGGQLDMTHKFFGVMDYDAEMPPDFDLLREGSHKEYDLEVYEGNITVIASERQNRLVIYT